MRARLRRILVGLSVFAAILVLLVAGLVVYILLSWDRPVIRAVRAMTAPKDAATVARGEYLYKYSMNCWTCHGSNDGRDPNEPQAGGKVFDMRAIGPGFGFAWGSNLTPDVDTGIGAWSDGELVRAIREGLDRDGRVIFPVMAYQFYHGLSDADALSLVAYMRTLAPVRHEVPARQLSFAAKALLAMGMVRAEAAITEPVSAPAKGPSIEYGEYLVWHASGCAECHTPRFPSNGQLDQTRRMGGGLFPIPEIGFSATAPNLTPDPDTGIGKWTEAQFADQMRRGLRPDGTVTLPFMPWPVYARWDSDDVRAAWLYLRSIAAVSHATPASVLTGKASTGSGIERGEGLFDVYCLVCHGAKGAGGSLSANELRGVAGSLDDDALRAFITEGTPGAEMPGFGKTLTKDQVADLVAFIRASQVSKRP